MDGPYTRLRHAQFRGPSTSDDYNARVEENYKDLMILFNRIRLFDSDLAEFFRRLVKDQIGLTRVIQDLEGRVGGLETAASALLFRTDAQADTARFNGGPFAVAEANRLTIDTKYGVILLPRVDVSSLSKLFFTNSDGEEMLPGTLETRVVPDPTSADGVAATVDSSDPSLAVVRKPGRVWERNIVVDAVDADGAILTFYLKVPTDLFTTDKSNVIIVAPFPAFSTDILSVAFTSTADPMMQEADGYTPINQTSMHANDARALGWVPPGGFTGDTINDAGPMAFHFDPRLVTAVKVVLRTRHPVVEASRYVYSYGLTQLDLRYDKYLSTGKAMIRFNAPTGKTISQVTDVQPEIWNTAGYDWPNVFSWRALWETSLNSNTYTTTAVPSSSRVWIEVTLNETPDKGTPALSGLKVTYT